MNTQKYMPKIHVMLGVCFSIEICQYVIDELQLLTNEHGETNKYTNRVTLNKHLCIIYRTNFCIHSAFILTSFKKKSKAKKFVLYKKHSN